MVIVAAAAILSMLDRNPGKKLSDLKKALPVAYTSLTMSPHVADEVKYGLAAYSGGVTLGAAGSSPWGAITPSPVTATWITTSAPP